MPTMIIGWLAVLLTALSVCNVSGYFIVVDANAEECFFDRVTAGTKMSLTFEVAEGGFLDIDVKVSIFVVVVVVVKYSGIYTVVFFYPCQPLTIWWVVRVTGHFGNMTLLLDDNTQTSIR